MTAHFFNLHNEDDGIRRLLADGVTTRISPGEHAMLSVVCIEAEPESARHSHLRRTVGRAVRRQRRAGSE